MKKDMISLYSKLVAVFWGIYLGIVGSAYAVAVSGIRILSDE